MLAYLHVFVLALPSTFYRKAGTLVALALSGIEGVSSVLLTPYRMGTFSRNCKCDAVFTSRSYSSGSSPHLVAGLKAFVGPVTVPSSLLVRLPRRYVMVSCPVVSGGIVVRERYFTHSSERWHGIAECSRT